MMINEWINEVSGPKWRWCAKRLSGNDTGSTGSHQSGPYIPKDFIFSVFPTLKQVTHQNSELFIPAQVSSHQLSEQDVRVVWYNNRLRGQTRNEARITQWAHPSMRSPLLDPDSTGALCVFAFYQDDRRHSAQGVDIWVCNDLLEEQIIEDLLGEIAPGEYAFHDNSAHLLTHTGDNTSNRCILRPEQLPPQWLSEFPSGAELIDFALQKQPGNIKFDPDTRLIKRRDCEFNIFKSVEECHVIPNIRHGFTSVNDFIYYANSVSNRRKARAGKSLELHAKQIFIEQGLTDFAHDQRTEGNKRPDFIFPSIEAYNDPYFNPNNLIMLAAKTTCKDRWRQILNEAARIDTAYLLTLQEGVSENQYKEMKSEGVKLVVPKQIHDSYPKSIRPELITLNQFIEMAKNNH